MTISAQTAITELIVPAGSPFMGFDFRVDDPADLKVYRDGVEWTAWSCSSYGPTGGIILFNDPTTEAHTFTVIRDEELSQEVVYDPHGSFPAESTEDALDKQAMLVQQQQVHIDRALKLPFGINQMNAELPAPEGGKMLQWNSGGNRIENSIYSDVELNALDASCQASAATATAQADRAETEADDAEASSTAAAASAALAEDWAEEAEDTEVTPGQYSALHHAAKAHDWAEEDPGVEVDPGEYSARHYATQAEAAANNITAQRYTALSTEDQTVITPGFSMSPTNKNAIVFLDGVRQVVDVDFTVGATSITLLEAIPADVRIVVESIAATAGATTPYADEAGDVQTSYAPDNYELDSGEVKTVDQHLAGLDRQVGLLGGFKNLLINGGMNIAQRGTSFIGLTNGGTQYTLDRWRFAESGAPTAVLDIKQTADHPSGGPGYCLEIDVTTAQASIPADDVLTLHQKIEAQNLLHLEYGQATAKTICLSFWAKAAVTGAYPVSLYQPDIGRSYVATFTINAANTWEYKTVIIPGDTSGQIDNDNDQGLRLSFSLGCGTDRQAAAVDQWGAGFFYSVSGVEDLVSSVSGNLRIADIQLEAGEVATPFERRPYGVELALCQRYYEIGRVMENVSVAGANGNYYCRNSVFFKTQKRDDSTSITLSSETYRQSNWATVSPTVSTDYMDVYKFRHKADGINTDVMSKEFYWAADAEL